MLDPIHDKRQYRSDAGRKRSSSWFAILCLVVSNLTIVILLTLLVSIFMKGGNWLSLDFLMQNHVENKPEESGVGPAIIGSLVICVLCGLVALPIGIGTAIFLEEFQPRNRILKFFHSLVQLNISNLAGVPSIVYGILGVTAFVYMFGAFHRIDVNKVPEVEFGVNYFYQVETLSGEYVKFPAQKLVHDTIDVTDSFQVDGQNVELVPFRIKKQILASADSISDEGIQFDPHLTVQLEATAKLKPGSDPQVYVVKNILGEPLEFVAEPSFVQSIRMSESVEAIREDGSRFELQVVDGAPSDPSLASQAARRGEYASFTKESTPFHFHLPFGKTILSAGLTLALVILPIVIIASQEAIRGVPSTLREAAFGMGATRWQAVRSAVLPSAIPGIMTGAILAMSRAIGEAAPILAVMGVVNSNALGSLMGKTPVLPTTIFKWAEDVNVGFENSSAAAIIVLLVILLMMNSVAVYIRHRYEKKLGG